MDTIPLLHLQFNYRSRLMVNIKHVHIVKPAGVTPSGTTYLSESDQSSAITHAPTIYIYRHPTTNQPFHTLVQTLISSLSQTLVDFYPIAGRVRYIPNACGRVELECNAEGVVLIEAESGLEVSDLGDFSPSPMISTLIPKVDYSTKPIHETPIVLVQVTSLRCGGITMGLAASHSVFDGQGALLFISEWCKRARGVVDPVRPFLDRTILKPCALLAKVVSEKNDGCVHIDYSPPPLLVGQSDDGAERAKETAVATLKLSAKQVAELKSKANLDNAAAGGRPYTRYETIAAHIWRCSSKARQHIDSQPTRLRIPTNFQNRLKPPLPPTFLGNMVLRVAVSGELLNNPLGHISAKIRQKLTSVDDKYVRDALAYLEKQADVTQFRNFHSLGCTMGGFFGNPNFEITSWLSLPIYGSDFGWGPEDYMGPGAIGFDGKSFVLPGHDEDGSVVIFMRLQVEYMDDFTKCFYEDI
ncbi:unnamed protein product [Rhodiola kirilowii]